MLKQLAALLRSLADRLDPPTKTPQGGGPGTPTKPV